jgi:hypothetical protein
MDNKAFSRHISLKNTSVDDRFWNGVFDTVRTQMLPYQYDALLDRVEGAEKSYCVDNFKKAQKVAEAIRNGETPTVYPEDRWEYKEGEVDDDSFHGLVFQESDLYKWLEAVGYSLSLHPDSALEKTADEVIDLISSAQLENGYLNILYIVNDRSKAFSNLRDKHELYCFGHLAEAAVSYYNATGKDKLLNTVCRYADHICSVFGENGVRGYPGHEEAELALVKLYNVTGCKEYLDTAKFFIDERGRKPYYFDIEQGIKRTDNDEHYHYHQAHRPVREQDEAVGHAVRAVYLYSAMADLSKEYLDDGLYEACKKLWNNIVTRKLYITGGVGATADGEAFSFNYDLPNDLAYCETCAAIGLIMFARRMLEIEPKAEYAEVMERALYNNVLGGMASDGKSFYYSNPLEVLPEASRCDSRKRFISPERQKWFQCACCPPNLARLITSLPEYCFTENDGTLFIHQYLGGEIRSDKGIIKIDSDYAENGKVKLSVSTYKPFTLAVRIPSFAEDYAISANYKTADGYAYIETIGDSEIELDFIFKPRLVKCSNLVRENVGRYALQNGVFIYCLESVDNGENLQLIKVKRDGVFVKDSGFIIADGYREVPDTELYSFSLEKEEESVKVRFIPYYLRANRGECEMNVYFRTE